ncbi:glycosyltransferase family 2 protein [uncultured Tateyamaria sp.]|uniref:glycosyltransferase family 2 protein n=1 Tax=uncultured Tateyamaria sp. TaxID=455651 RepID=UPI0026088B7A|nr:glycosyltransferase family 2 protein [uncultured Tateyamaria sp.]
MTTWGLAATILAPAPKVLRFAAYHLEHGAHRLYIYLDAPNDVAFDHLKAHPKIRVQTCDTAHWERLGGKRPGKHQVRQAMNATHAYQRRTEVDWLIHMDVDEFLVPAAPIADLLGALPAQQTTARVRPMELLGGSDTAFKAFIPAGPARRTIVNEIYRTFGAYIKGGFLSHVAGKVFVRKGLDDISIQIHNAFQNGNQLDGDADIAQIALAHCHAPSWDAWRAAFAYRHAKGSYRSELRPATPPDQGGMSLHDLFAHLYDDQGENGLHAFYDEVIGDSPTLRARLSKHGLLREVDLALEAALARHFPDAAV